MWSVVEHRSMDDLLEAARDARRASYAPYSEYRVGAALRAADGTVFAGCNIENANYSNSLHAEEVALAEAVREGYREFDALAVSTSEEDGQTPCGMCRQSLVETASASNSRWPSRTASASATSSA